VLGPRSSVLVPADTIPDRVLEVFLEEGKPHLHTSSEPDHLKDELAFMEEYADASLSNISTELEAFKPVMTEKLEGYLDSKIARGNGQRLVPDEDGRVGVSTGMLGDSPYLGTGDVTWPDGSTLLATHEEGEDPELDALVARVEWLKWRQRMLALEQREPGR